jgi:putative tryptophan/tyrosine transport system substrate-binding protein
MHERDLLYLTRDLWPWGTPMRRRAFITLLGGAVAWPLVARAQQPMPVIGYLSLATPGGSAAPPGFMQGLTETGYVVGQNVAIEYRWAEDPDQMPALAAELVRRQPSVIYANPTAAARAVKAATSTIPIVFGTGVDPVKFGLVTSLNRPGSNATGTTILAIELEGKRLALLHQLVPASETIAALLNPKNPSVDIQAQNLQDAGRKLGRQIRIIYAANDIAIDAAFAALGEQRVRALTLGGGDTYFSRRRIQIVTLANHHAISTMYFGREFSEVGGLVSYGVDGRANNRQLGLYVGRILKGEKPAELPVMRPTKFDLVINLTTAKALSLDVPDRLLALADEVIE